MIWIIIFISLKDFSDFFSVLILSLFSHNPDISFNLYSFGNVCLVCIHRALWPFGPLIVYMHSAISRASVLIIVTPTDTLIADQALRLSRTAYKSGAWSRWYSARELDPVRTLVGLNYSKMSDGSF